MLYALEHRFYGESQPFHDLSTENLKYLTAEQALSDIGNFIMEMASQGVPINKLIVVGGSYPGALSAWFRQRYPQIAMASWSSSGVVYPVEDFWRFDEQVYRSTVKSGEWCPQAIQDITEKVQKGITDPASTTRAKIMETMGASPGMHNGDFAFYFADIFVESVQYGDRTGLCDLVRTIKDKDLIDQLEALQA